MHPILTQRKPSPEQQPAILADGRDVLVVAGAGTGKTTTLVARMLHLLASGAPLRNVVAVTFTVKAAQEMRNRLRKYIGEYLADATLPPAERASWQGIADGLDATRIGTIHSLCTEILRSHPAEAGLDPRFTVLDEAQAARLAQDAVDEAVAWATEDKAAVELFRLFPPGGFGALVAALLGARLKAAELLEARLWGQWQQVAAQALAERFLAAPEVTAALDDLRALADAGAIRSAAARSDTLALNLLELLSTWDEITLAASAGDLARLCALLDAVRRLVGGNYGQAAAWKPHQPPKETVKELRLWWDEQLKPLLKDVDAALDVELAAAMPQLQRVLAYAVQRYAAAKQELGALDFDDLEHGALALLRDFPAVRARWQQEIDALLVDEFQDTNGRQRELVRLLNGERGRLFLVGDAKQSIYRFRGAEVQVFRQEQQRMAAGHGLSFDLTVSYRTHRQLLALLNTVLAGVLGRADDPQQPWRAPSAALHAEHAECQHGLAAPFVELQLAAGSKSSGALERAAAALAQRLPALVAESQGKLSYGDVAILCRSYRGFAAYEDALEQAGIPYVTVAGRGFYDRPEVRDLCNSLKALADPTDDLALAGLLRSPAIGLTDAELLLLRLDADGKPRPLWPALQAAMSELAQSAAALVAELHEQAGRVTVAELLRQWLEATDYSAKLLLAGQQRAERNVAKLLDDARRSQLVSVGDFLEYVANIRDVGAREGEARADDLGAVTIMTVHQAKGMEFPVVVIGDAGSPGGGGRGDFLADERLGVVPLWQSAEGKRPLVCKLAAEAEAQQEQAETNRLLYVAATRTAEKLILNGHVKVNDKGALNADGWLGQWLAMLGIASAPAGYSAEGNGEHAWATELEGHGVACTLYEPNFQPQLAPAPPVAGEPEPAGELAWSPALLAPLDGALPAPDEDQRQVWRVVPHVDHPGAPAWVIGKLVHEAIAAWRFPVDASLGPWVEARARAYGLADDVRLRDAVRKTRELLVRLQTSPIFAEIAAADRRLHELPYTYTVDNRVETGRIDLLYCCQDGWTLIDFKTDRIRTPDNRRLVIEGEGYGAQAARYAAALQSLAGQSARVLLCLLDDNGKVSVETVRG